MHTLPLRTRTLCLTPARRAVMAGRSGSGPFGVEAHIFWFGHPAHESAVPACSDSGPGQCSGSGATSSGFCFRGFARTSSTGSGASSDGAMAESDSTTRSCGRRFESCRIRNRPQGAGLMYCTRALSYRPRGRPRGLLSGALPLPVRSIVAHPTFHGNCRLLNCSIRRPNLQKKGKVSGGS